MAVIKNAKNRDVMYEADGLSMKETVKKALSEGLLLVDADLRGADLSDTDFTGLDFTGAYLSCANFTNSTLEGCNFNMAIVSAADFTGAVLCNARLLGARVSHAIFPEHSAVVTAGTGLPFFTCGTSVEVAGQEPMPVSQLMNMTEEDAYKIGGTSLRDALPKLKNAVSFFSVTQTQ